MKKTFLFLMILLFATSAYAQKRYDEIKYPPLGNFEKANVEEFKLDNGITFYLLEDKELPLISVSATVRTGSILIPNSKAGLAGMVGSVMREGGSVNYPADELNLLLEDNAASMGTFIGFSSGGASMNILKEDFDELLPVFVDLIQNPLFPQDKINLTKTQLKSSISRRNDDQASIASREFGKLMYGKDSPYTAQTEYATIDNITREDLVAFHKEAFVGNNMTFGVIGDFDTREMKRKLQQAFGSLPAGNETNIIFPEVNYDFQPGINFINKSDVNQSYVLMGHIGGLRENPDYAALQVMNQVLSGGFSGRLFQSVRTDLGLAYSVGGSYGSNINYPGTFSLTTMTQSATTSQAIDAIIAEVKKLQNAPVSAKELTDTKDRFLNSLIFRYDTKGKILNERISKEYNGLSEDAFDEYVEELKKVTIADIQRVAKEYLQPENMQILVVGNANELGNQLEKYGEINEIDITIPTPQVDEEEEIEGDPVKGEEVFSNMAAAIVSNPSEVSGVFLDATTVLGGQNVPMKATYNFRTMSINAEMTTPGGTINLAVENGQGTMNMAGQSQPLPPQMVQPLTQQLKRDLVNIALKSDEFTSIFTGTEEVDGVEYNVINVSGEINQTFLVDPETGLPGFVRYSEFNPQMGAQVNIEQKFSEWTTADGITYPYLMEVFMNGQKAQEQTVKEHKSSE